MKKEKQLLQKRGWSYRSAALQLGVSYQYLSDVLNKKRSSRRLVQRINEIPVYRAVE